VKYRLIAKRTALGFAVVSTALVTILAAEPRFTVGVCTHFGQSKGILPANLSLMRQAGVTAIRDEISWSAVERQKGRYAMPESASSFVNGALDAGIEPLLIFDYGNRFYDNGDKPLSAAAIEAFTRYAEFVVRHFKGKLHLYEVWNEWDIAIGHTAPGSAENYARLLKAVYPRIKAIDRSITVLGGCPTSGGIRKGWLDQMLAAGALESLDAVSIHTYNYSGQSHARTPEAWAEFVAETERGIRKYSHDRDVPIYVTEMGWPTHTGPRSTPPEQSAAFLARMFLLARTMPYVKGIWWYDFQDDGWKADYNENNFGLVRPDLTPKPSYFALQGIAILAAGAEFAGKLETAESDTIALKFRLKYKDALAIWSHNAQARTVAVATAAPKSGSAVIAVAGRPAIERLWGLRDWAKGAGAELFPNQISVEIGETPVVVYGDQLSMPAPAR